MTSLTVYFGFVNYIGHAVTFEVATVCLSSIGQADTGGLGGHELGYPFTGVRSAWAPHPRSGCGSIHAPRERVTSQEEGILYIRMT